MAGNLINVPYNHRVTQCAKCKADIVWIETKAGTRMPVSVMPSARFPDLQPPNAALRKDGVGVAHWADCPNANEFRRKR